MSGLVIRTHRSEGSALVRLEGELDVAEGERLTQSLEVVESESPEVLVIDLSGLTFMDSTGLHVMVQTFFRAEARGTELLLLPGPDNVHRVFCVTGLHERLPFLSACDLADDA